MVISTALVTLIAVSSIDYFYIPPSVAIDNSAAAKSNDLRSITYRLPAEIYH